MPLRTACTIAQRVRNCNAVVMTMMDVATRYKWISFTVLIIMHTAAYLTFKAARRGGHYTISPTCGHASLAEFLDHASRIHVEDVTREPLWDNRFPTINTSSATPAFIAFDTYGQTGNQLLTIMDMYKLSMSLGRTLVLLSHKEDDRPRSLWHKLVGNGKKRIPQPWGLTYSVAEMERQLAPYGGILHVDNTRDRACQAALTNITQFKLDLKQICEGHPALLHLSGEMAWNIGPHIPTMVCIDRKRKLDNAYHMAHRPIKLRPKPNALSFAMARAMHVRGRQLARSPLRVCAAHVRRFDCEFGGCKPECRKRWASILSQISNESKCGYWFIATNSPYSESIKLRELLVASLGSGPGQGFAVDVEPLPTLSKMALRFDALSVSTAARLTLSLADTAVVAPASSWTMAIGHLREESQVQATRWLAYVEQAGANANGSIPTETTIDPSGHFGALPGKPCGWY